MSVLESAAAAPVGTTPDLARVKAALTNAIVAKYQAKAKGGKYIEIIKTKLGGMSIPDIIAMFEAVKKVPFGTRKNSEQSAKAKAWLEDRNYKSSAPTKKLELDMTQVPSILAKYGWLDTDVSSWSAFIAHFEPQLRPLVDSLWLLKTPSQSANYTRGSFMLMNFSEAINYAMYRTALCIACVDIASGILTEAELFKIFALDQSVRAKTLSTRLAAARAQLPTKAEVDAIPADSMLGPFKMPVAATDRANRAWAVAGALTVEWRMIYQCKDIRGAPGSRAITATDFNLIGALARMVHSRFVGAPGVTAIAKETQVRIMDLEDPNRKQIFEAYRFMKICVRSVRRAVNSPDGGLSASGPQRDYSLFSMIF